MSDVPIFDPMTNVDPMRAEVNEDSEDHFFERWIDGFSEDNSEE